MWPRTQQSVDNYLVLHGDGEIEATAVPHPFGRGQFKQRAKDAVIPEVLLNELLKTHSPSQGNSHLLPACNLGGAVRSKVGDIVQPSLATGGRARALRLRAERYLQQEPERRPGKQVKEHPFIPLEPESRSEYERSWPALEPGGYNAQESSDVLTDDTSSDFSSDTCGKLIVTISGKDKYSRARNSSQVTARKRYHSNLSNDDFTRKHFDTKQQHFVSSQASHRSNSVSVENQRIRVHGRTVSREKHAPVHQSKVGRKTGLISYEDDPSINTATTTSNDGFECCETVGPTVA